MKKHMVLSLSLLCCFSVQLLAMEGYYPPTEPGVEEVSEEEAEAFWAIPKEKPLYKRPIVYGGAAIAAGTLAALAAATYAGLAWWQRNQVNNVLKKYGQTLNAILPEYRVLVIAAYTKNLKGMRKLSNIALSGTPKWLLFAMAELYFKEAPTQKNIQALITLLSVLPSPAQ